MNQRKKIKNILPYLLFILILTGRIVFADEPPKKEIGFDEKLGEVLPLNLSFLDEYGQPVVLKDLFTKPTLFMVVYYRCTGLCSPLMNGVAQVAGELDMQAGKDYNIVTISFDPKETYLMASEKKKNYFDEMKKKIPDASWHFLTGDSASDARICDAIGFRYVRQGNDFIHSTAIIAVSPQGKIARYLYGTDFNPFDVKLALTEASEGKTGPTISKLVKLCFSYDPGSRKYVLSITRIAGGGIFVLLIAFVAILTIKKRKTNKINRNSEQDNTDSNNERNKLNG
ncbi:MAG: SCO family protein [Ignavibacteria bacterium]